MRKATTANGNDNIREQQEDTVTEIVIDEFSLLLFRSLDDYNVTYRDKGWANKLGHRTNTKSKITFLANFWN